MESRPHIDAGHHPIEQPYCVIATPPIKRAARTTKQWIEAGVPGGMIFGHQRHGKTSAIDALVQALPGLCRAEMPTFAITVRHTRNATEGRFFSDCLQSVGHETTVQYCVARRRDRFRDFLVSEARRLESEKVVLFVDDAQRLAEPHFAWLCDIFNELFRRRIRAFVVLVGELDLKNQRDAFVESGRMQIVGRFMVEEHQFHGIASADELRECMTVFDAKDFPENSGWSYARYFAPRPFDFGWRYASEASSLWTTWKAVHREAGLPGSLEIPMQYLWPVLRGGLLSISDPEADDCEMDREHWTRLIRQCGYVRAAKYIRREESAEDEDND